MRLEWEWARSGPGSPPESGARQAPIEGKGGGVNYGRGSPLGSGGEPLAGGACRQGEQAEEGGLSVREGRKLAHVADALGEGDGGGPAT